jgi:hypothetical protein
MGILRESANYFKIHNNQLVDIMRAMTVHQGTLEARIHMLRGVAFEAATKTRNAFQRTIKAETNLQIMKEKEQERVRAEAMLVHTMDDLFCRDATLNTTVEPNADLLTPTFPALPADHPMAAYLPQDDPITMEAVMGESGYSMHDTPQVPVNDATGELSTITPHLPLTPIITAKVNVVRKAKINSHAQKFTVSDNSEVDDLKKLIKSFFQDEMTGLSTHDTEYTIEEQAAVDQMMAKTSYDANKKQWTTGLLFKENPRLSLDNNRGRARAVLKSVFQKLHKKSESDALLTKSTYNEMFDKFCRPVGDHEIHLPSYTLESHAEIGRAHV